MNVPFCACALKNLFEVHTLTSRQEVPVSSAIKLCQVFIVHFLRKLTTGSFSTQHHCVAVLMSRARVRVTAEWGLLPSHLKSRIEAVQLQNKDMEDMTVVSLHLFLHVLVVVALLALPILKKFMEHALSQNWQVHSISHLLRSTKRHRIN